MLLRAALLCLALSVVAYSASVPDTPEESCFYESCELCSAGGQGSTSGCTWCIDPNFGSGSCVSDKDKSSCSGFTTRFDVDCTCYKQTTCDECLKYSSPVCFWTVDVFGQGSCIPYQGDVGFDDNWNLAKGTKIQSRSQCPSAAATVDVPEVANACPSGPLTDDASCHKCVEAGCWVCPSGFGASCSAEQGPQCINTCNGPAPPKCHEYQSCSDCVNDVLCNYCTSTGKCLTVTESAPYSDCSSNPFVCNSAPK